MHSFELQLDRAIKNCTNAFLHKGISLSGTFRKGYEEWGLKGMLNPTRRSFPISRGFRVLPYTFLQANMVRERNVSTYFNARPGLGLTSILLSHSIISIRPQVQVGYNFNQRSAPRDNGLTLELKTGIGFNPYRYRWAKRQQTE